MSSSLDSIYKKMVSPPEPNGAEPVFEVKYEPDRHISPVIAHELNNILTIIQGYADRLRNKNAGNQTLEAQLKLISDAARRATILVRTGASPEMNTAVFNAPAPTGR